MKALILSAGLGTRMRPYTLHLPKPSLPFLNIPIMHYVWSLIAPLKPTDLVINTHHLPEKIQTTASMLPLSSPSSLAKGQLATRLHFSPETEKPLGPGGGIWKAQNFLDGADDFVVCNGDEILFPSDQTKLPTAHAQHLREGNLATLYVMRDARVGTQFGGVWADTNGDVHGFGKVAPTSSISVAVGASRGTSDKLTGFHYVGILFLNRRIFQYLPEGESNILYDALTKAIAAGERVRIFEDPNLIWFETGNPADYLDAHAHCVRAISNATNGKSNTISKFYSDLCLSLGRHSARSEQNLFIGSKTSFPDDLKLVQGSFACIGDRAIIGKNVTLENVVVLPDANVPDGSQLKDMVFPAV